MSFEEETEESHSHPYFPDIKITQSILLNALSNALNDIIWNTVKYDAEPKVKILIKNNINQTEIHTFTERTESLISIRSNINQYMSEDGGVLIFVYSVILSRGIDRINNDKVYDDSLIGMFGNTSVELMNLLLVGYATQNVYLYILLLFYFIIIYCLYSCMMVLRIKMVCYSKVLLHNQILVY